MRKSLTIALPALLLILIAGLWKYSGVRSVFFPESLMLPTAPHVVKLSWQASAKSASYNIYRAPRPFRPYRKVGTSNTTQFLDFPVAVPNTFYYTVTGVNGYGESAPSVRVLVSLP